MFVFRTLPLYIARQFGYWLLCTFLALVCIASIFDIVELMRRSSGKYQVTTEVIIEMALLKLPHLVLDLLPFAVLVGGIFAFWRLARAQELVIARTSGMSIWQILVTPGLITIGAGAIAVMVFNPFAAATRAQFEALESEFLNQNRSDLAISETGVWLRQGTPDHQSVIHANDVGDHGTLLREVFVLNVTAANELLSRIDAKVAKLNNGYWQLLDGYRSTPGVESEPFDEFRLPTDLTPSSIEDSFASADTISFWDLPKFIRTMEDAGFNANAHRLHWHSLMAMPFLLAAMVLISATFSVKTGRRSSAALMVLSGIGTGFVLYFFSNIVHALGMSMSVPPELAAWMPAGVSLMLGVTALLHLEDG